MTLLDRARPYGLLLAIAGLALALRLVLVLAVHPTCPFDSSQVADVESARAYLAQEVTYDGSCFFLKGDSLGAYLQGIRTAEGELFLNPFDELWGQEAGAHAGKPPAMTLGVAGLALVGIDDPTAYRVLTALVGSVVVFVLGLVGWRLLGRRAGLVAATIAALYPMLWINDWRMTAETFVTLFVALAVLAAYRFWVRPGMASAAWLGAALGLSVYARAEMLLLLPLLVVPLAWGLPRRRPATRVKLGLLSALTAAAVLLPWTAYLLAQSGGTQVVQSGGGSVLLNGSCDSTFYGEYLGYLDFACFDSEVIAETTVVGSGASADDRARLIDEVYREHATAYISENRARLPVVAVARLGRLWDVYRPVQNVSLNANVEGRSLVDSWLGLIAYAVLVPFAVYGGYRLWRRRIAVSPLVGPVLAVSATAIVSYGLTRYRTAAEVALVVAAAAGIELLLRRRAAGTDDASTVPEPGVVEVAAARLEPRPPASRRRKRELAAWGAIGAVSLTLVVALSASAEPPERDQPIDATADVVELCRYARANGLDQPSFIASLTGPTVQQAIDHFQYLQPLAPPELQADIDLVVATLTTLRDSGLTGTQFLQQYEEEAVEGFAAGQRLLVWADEHCPR